MFGDTSCPLYSFFTYIIIRWYNNNSIPLKRYIILLIYHYTISPDMFFGNEHDKEYPITPSVVPNKSCVLLYNHNRCLYYSATLLYCILLYTATSISYQLFGVYLLHYQHGFLTHSITYHVTEMCTYTSSNYLPSSKPVDTRWRDRELNEALSVHDNVVVYT